MADNLSYLMPAATMAALSLTFLAIALGLHAADKRAQRMRRAAVESTGSAWALVWAQRARTGNAGEGSVNAGERMRRAAGRIADHGAAMRGAYASAAGMVCDTMADSFETVEGAIYWAHVRIENQAGEMVSHKFEVRATDGREAREWAHWALYESGASSRSYVTMIRDGKRIVA